MPDLRRPPGIYGSGTSRLVPDHRTLSRPYRYGGTEFEPIPDEPAPRQIVARLHKEIAAKSPEHAALVAAFEKLPRPPSPDQDGESAPGYTGRPAADARRARWRKLRDAGMERADAAAEMEISKRTADRYEQWLETVRGCAA